VKENVMKSIRMLLVFGIALLAFGMLSQSMAFANGSKTVLVFPQLVAGGTYPARYGTEVVGVNLTDSPQSVVFDWNAADSSYLYLDGNFDGVLFSQGAKASLTLRPRETTRLTLRLQSGTVSTGTLWVTVPVTDAGNVAVGVIMNFQLLGQDDQPIVDTTVMAANLKPTASFAVRYLGNTSMTGFAVTNPGPNPIKLSVQLRDGAGRSIGSVGEVQLGGYCERAIYVHQVVNVPSGDFVGSADVATAGGEPVAYVVLQLVDRVSAGVNTNTMSAVQVFPGRSVQ
jgi:hypothetical protein